LYKRSHTGADPCFCADLTQILVHFGGVLHLHPLSPPFTPFVAPFGSASCGVPTVHRRGIDGASLDPLWCATLTSSRLRPCVFCLHFDHHDLRCRPMYVTLDLARKNALRWLGAWYAQAYEKNAEPLRCWTTRDGLEALAALLPVSANEQAAPAPKMGRPLGSSHLRGAKIPVPSIAARRLRSRATATRADSPQALVYLFADRLLVLAPGTRDTPETETLALLWGGIHRAVSELQAQGAQGAA